MVAVLCILSVHESKLYAQSPANQPVRFEKNDSITRATIAADSLVVDSLHRHNLAQFEKLNAPVDTTALNNAKDSVSQQTPPAETKKKFIPDSKKATWLALIIPGGGQIYNRKYWKLPIVYGGFVGCTYALSWNNKMYKDYSQAYMDIMDDDPNTKSYEDFLPPSVDIKGNEKTYQERFRKRKDIYRRQRDLSIFAFIGVYVLSIIDAYVDAELSDFDISKNLGLKIEPGIINDKHNKFNNAVGLQCSLKF